MLLTDRVERGDDAVVEVEARDLGQLHTSSSARVPRDVARGRTDLSLGQDPGRDLVQQRLEQVVVVPVDQGDIDGRHRQRLRGEEAAEAAPDDDDSMASVQRGALSPLVETAALVEPPEHRSAGPTSTTPMMNAMISHKSTELGRGGLIDGQSRREDVRVLRDAPAEEDGDHRRRGQQPDPGAAELPPQRAERRETEDSGRDHEWEPLVQQAVVDVGSVVTEDEQPDERRDPGCQADQKGSNAEIRRHHVVVVTVRVGEEERSRR